MFSTLGRRLLKRDQKSDGLRQDVDQARQQRVQQRSKLFGKWRAQNEIKKRFQCTSANALIRLHDPPSKLTLPTLAYIDI